MRFVKLSIAIALCSAMVVSSAVAQGLQQPMSVQPGAVTHDQNDYYTVTDEDGTAPIPGDVPVIDGPVPESILESLDQPRGQPLAGDGRAAMYDPHADGSCCEPWRLFPQMPSGLTITGWIEAGATVAADHPPSNFVFPVTFNDREEFVMNQLYLSMEKPVCGGGCGWDLGGRVDVVYGTDARHLEVPGLELRRDGTDKWGTERFYRLAMPQLYAEVAHNDLSVKIGHWYTILGYEVPAAPGNFFYSHAYTMAYGEPYTHTGVIADWDYSDRWTFVAGVHNGWDNFDSVQQRAGLIGGATWTSCDRGTSLAFAVTAGDEINARGVYATRTAYSLVLSHEINDCWTYVLQHDLGVQRDNGGVGVDAEWYGINQYLFYTINDSWELGGRFEWFRDDDGAMVDGSIGNFYEASLGLNWTPNHNLIFRPEVRWDWFSGTGLPLNDGTKDNQFTAAFDLIFLF